RPRGAASTLPPTQMRRLTRGSSGLEIQQRFAARRIHRCRGVVVHDEPVAVDLSKAVRCADPETTTPRPVLQRSAEPVETMPERNITPNSDRDVAHLNADRTLEYREGRYPVLPFCFCSDVLKPRSHVAR